MTFGKVEESGGLDNGTGGVGEVSGSVRRGGIPMRTLLG